MMEQRSCIHTGTSSSLQQHNCCKREWDKQLLLNIQRLTPAQDAQTIDHGGVRVGAHQTVRIQEPILVKHHAGQVLQVDLVNDSWTRRNNSHVSEGFGAPLQRPEIIFTDRTIRLTWTHDSFIPLETEIFLCCGQTPDPDFSEGCQTCVKSNKWNEAVNETPMSWHTVGERREILLPVEVHLDGMINDEVSGTNWINLFWVATEFHHCITHGSEVDHSRNTAAWHSTGWSGTAQNVMSPF